VYHAGKSPGYRNAIREWNWHTNDVPDEIHQQADVLLVDSYLATSDRMNSLRNKCRFMVVLDDYNRMVYPADLVINPNVYFRKEFYRNQFAEVVGGRFYTILREAFRKAFLNDDGQSKRREGVLVTLGGSDVHRLSGTIVSLLSDLNLKIKIIAPEEDVRLQLENDFPDVTVYGALDQWQMRKVSCEAELVISACGQTLHELAALGKPTIGIVVGADQQGNQSFYLNSGFLWFDFHWERPEWKSQLPNAVRVMQHQGLAEFIGSLSPFLPDRNGVKRYYEIISRMYYSEAL
jgi:UDP-2,4-diacetamido-2,4,6-trideoxy-beta-L-altropyranose hydrolase